MPSTNWQRWKGIMKCYPFEEKRLAKWRPPYIVQPKFDGVRCRAVHTDAGYLLLSSEENVIFSVPHINQILDKTSWHEELDGELYCHGMKFEEIVAITSRTQNLHPDREFIRFHVFDIVNDLSQMERTIQLEGFKERSEYIRVAPFWLCESLDDIVRVFDKLVDQGYEGIIVRHLENHYERKRSTWVMKFKPKKEDDYEIVGAVEEVDKEGSPKDTLGALVCRSGDGNLFNVGTGFSEDRRRELWEAKNLLKGQVARVKYQHITSGKQVPRFPVFVDIVVKP